VVGMPENLRIDSHTHRTPAVVNISGQLVLGDVPRILAALAGTFGRGHTAVICDLCDLAVPPRLAPLMVFPTALRAQGGWPRRALHLAAPDPELHRAFARSGIDRFVPVHRSLGDAMIGASADAFAVLREVRLSPVATSPGAARDALRQLQRAEGLASQAEERGLIVISELTTNAIRHVGQPFVVTLALSPARLLVAVTDCSRRQPQVHPPRGDAISGHGLRLVAGLSQDWGVCLVHPTGKTVWAMLPDPLAA
jgi:hypothetical protein